MNAQQNDEQLRLIAVFHYVVGGLAALIALFPIFHLIIGLIFIFEPEKFATGNQAPPAFIGWFFVMFAAGFIAMGWLLATFIIITGRFIAKRKHYMFCVVMAGIECIFMPFGTVLGVFTIIILMRDSVKQIFGAVPATDPLEPAPAESHVHN